MADTNRPEKSAGPWRTKDKATLGVIIAVYCAPYLLIFPFTSWDSGLVVWIFGAQLITSAIGLPFYLKMRKSSSPMEAMLLSVLIACAFVPVVLIIFSICALAFGTW